jgi:Leucine-rich repeat (LRR) protein
MTQIINFFECIGNLIHDNIEYFTEKTKEEWGINDFNKWCENGRPINKNVIGLDISSSNIKSLEGIENLINLKYLNCNNNNLTSLEGIENLINLKYLNCNNNNLTSLEGIENLINLKYLNCNNNNLTSLEGIENLTNLNTLYCIYNQLISLEGIENLVNLEILHCNHNQITSLKGIENLTKFIKNNNELHGLCYAFINFNDFDDCDDNFELKFLFDSLIKSKNINETNDYITKIEQMIIELNGFQQYVLK